MYYPGGKKIHQAKKIKNQTAKKKNKLLSQMKKRNNRMIMKKNLHKDGKNRNLEMDHQKKSCLPFRASILLCSIQLVQ